MRSCKDGISFFALPAKAQPLSLTAPMKAPPFSPSMQSGNHDAARARAMRLQGSGRQRREGRRVFLKRIGSSPRAEGRLGKPPANPYGRPVRRVSRTNRHERKTHLYAQLRARNDKTRRIVFFGGAGVSTESGIPDFRGTDGLYAQTYAYPPERILSHDFFFSHTSAF